MTKDARIRRARFNAAAKRRAVVDVETAIGTMEQTISALNRFIAFE